MVDPYLGEIRMFAGVRPPAGWAFCEGQILPISSNESLHTLLGTIYGGNGVNTFALPDLRGRIPVGVGQGPGLSNYALGARPGTETVTLSTDHLPAHSHALMASMASATQQSPERAAFAATAANVRIYPDSAKPTIAPRQFSAAAITSPTGPPQPHENMMPTATIRYMIALDGQFPSTS